MLNKYISQTKEQLIDVIRTLDKIRVFSLLKEYNDLKVQLKNNEEKMKSSTILKEIDMIKEKMDDKDDEIWKLNNQLDKMNDEFNRGEDVEQIQYVDWLSKTYPNVLFNADCGGVRYGSGLQAILRGKRMKRAGHAKGFPDLVLYVKNSKYYALFIEMKSENGKLSPSQMIWLSELNKTGYYFAKACYGFEDARETTERYMNG